MENKKQETEEGATKPEETSSQPGHKETWDLLRTHYKKILLVALVFLVLFATAFTKTLHLDLPYIESDTRDSMDQSFVNGISKSVRANNPHLPEAEQRLLVERALEKARTEDVYKQTLAERTKEVQDTFYDETGQMYLLSIDPYLWYHKAENVLHYGHVGNTKKEGCDNDGRCGLRKYDSFLLAPDGDYVHTNLFPYIIAYTYAFLHFFASNLSLLTVLFYSSVFLSILTTLVVFLITHKLTRSLIASFFAALFVAVHQTLVARTMAGMGDTDGFTILFPLCIFWLILKAQEARKISSASMWGLLIGVLVAACAMTWGGWWVVFDTILLAMGAYLIYELTLALRLHKGWHARWKHLQENMQLRRHLLLFGIIIFVSGILITVFLDFHRFKTAPITLLETLIGLKATAKGLWPNVYATVDELQGINIVQALANVGTSLIVFGSLVGLVLFMLRKERDKGIIAGSLLWYVALLALKGSLSAKLFVIGVGVPVLVCLAWLVYKKKKESVFPYVFLAIWIGAMLFASLQAKRFVMVFLPFMAILLGILIRDLQLFLEKAAKKHLHINKNILNLLLVILLLFVLIKPVAVEEWRYIPAFDDGFHDAMDKIRSESAPDAIIASWWDFGHFFKAIGNRKVIFDGGTQNRPQAHWMGRVFLSENETEAIAVLRMLACGGNTAYDLLNEELHNPLKSVTVINTLLEKSKTQGIKVLEKITSKEKAQLIAEKMYCAPPEMYLIISDDLLKKSIAWSHIGGWDFDKAHIWNQAKNLNKEELAKYIGKEFSYSEEEQEQIIQSFRGITNSQEAKEWISEPLPYYLEGGECQAAPMQNDSILCLARVATPQGARADLVYNISTETKEVVVANSRQQLHPRSIVWTDETGFHEKKYSENVINQSVALFQQSSRWNTVTMHPRLSKSMMTKLSVLNGKGLNHFTLFDVQHGHGIVDTIFVWEVNWEGNDDGERKGEKKKVK